MSKSQTKDFFNNTSGDYSFDREEEYAFEVQKRTIFRMIQNIDGSQKKAIDIGCGSGLLTRELLQRGFEVWGTDISDEMISIANSMLKEKNINSDKVHYSIGDIENLDFPDNHFDVIINIGVFEYLSSYTIALQEIYRVLKPSGVAIITLPTKSSAFYIPYNLTEKTILPFFRTLKKLFKKKVSQSCPKLNLCTPWSFDNQLSALGFKKAESEFCIFFFYPLYPFFKNFSEYISKKLEVFANSKLFGWLGTQYVVKLAKK